MEEIKKEELLKILKDGAKAWNHWRSRSEYFKKFWGVDLTETNMSGVCLKKVNLSQTDLSRSDLSGTDFGEANLRYADLRRADLSKTNLSDADLTGADLGEANLKMTNLSRANLSEANLNEAALINASHLNEAVFDRANLSDADLTGVNLSLTSLSGADLSEANLNKANLSGANLNKTNLRGANLSKANLSGADLSGAVVIKSNLKNAKLTSCRVYGISAWDIEFSENTEQRDLIITPHDQPTITIDNLEVAQFIYLLLKNEKVRHIFDAIKSKVVLILGRFTKDRKAVLDALREELRRMNLTPVLFDFDKPASRDLTGTIETLSRMSRFIIADLTDPSSIPQELATIVPLLRTTPILPLRLVGSSGYRMFDDLTAYNWVLKVHEYKDGTTLISTLPVVIAPANEMAEKFRQA